MIQYERYEFLPVINSLINLSLVLLRLSYSTFQTLDVNMVSEPKAHISKVHNHIKTEQKHLILIFLGESSKAPEGEGGSW